MSAELISADWFRYGNLSILTLFRFELGFSLHLGRLTFRWAHLLAQASSHWTSLAQNRSLFFSLSKPSAQGHRIRSSRIVLCTGQLLLIRVSTFSIENIAALCSTSTCMFTPTSCSLQLGDIIHVLSKPIPLRPSPCRSPTFAWD